MTTPDTKGRGEVLADLYAAAGEDTFERAALDSLVAIAGYGWRCLASLEHDEGKCCSYVNVPMLAGNPDEAPCANCGAPRFDDADTATSSTSQSQSTKGER